MSNEPSEVTLRPRRPGDIGWLLMRQAEIYAKEYGYTDIFEVYVARSLPPFLDAFDEARDGIWIAERDGRRLGAIAIQHQSDGAQLRYYFVEKAARGTGIGSLLMQTALDFCKKTGQSPVYLWTCSDLEDAARMYQRHGFAKLEEAPCPWKDGVVQEKWILQSSA